MAPLTDAEIEDRLRVILESPAFDKKNWDYVRIWFDRFVSWLQGLSPEAKTALIIGCVILLAAFVGSLILSTDAPAVVGKRQDRALASPQAADHDLDALAVEARALAEAGKLREAGRALQQAAYMRLSRQRGLSWRPELADWEWVAVLGRGRTLREFTSLTQRLAFGPRPDAAIFTLCEQLYQELAATRA